MVQRRGKSYGKDAKRTPRKKQTAIENQYSDAAGRSFCSKRLRAMIMNVANDPVPW